MNPLADAIDLALLKRVLVIKLRHHGDVLLAAPVFSVLKAHAPQLEIDALVYADTAPMLSGHPAIAQLHLVDRDWKRAGLVAQAGGEWRLWQALRARRYDLIVHLTEHRRGRWLTRLLKPRYAVAPRVRKDEASWAATFSHLYSLPVGGNRRHTAETHLDALRRLGIQPAEGERGLTLVPGAAAETRVEALLAEHGLTAGGFIHLHPAARWMFKTWPAERSAGLINRLAADGHRLVLTCAPAANEMALNAAILGQAGGAGVIDLSGMLSLKELAALTGRARLFIGVDSAPMHIAAAMGTPAVALFGPSGEIEWGPWQVAQRVVVSQHHPCRPCGMDGCGGGKVSECLTTLPVTRVLDEVRSLLNQTAAA